MTKRQLRELIRNAIKEYMGTGSSGGNAGDGNSIPSQRMGGGSFADDESEMEYYNNKNVGYGAMGNHTSGMEKQQSIGNPNRTRNTRF